MAKLEIELTAEELERVTERSREMGLGLEAYARVKLVGHSKAVTKAASEPEQLSWQERLQAFQAWQTELRSRWQSPVFLTDEELRRENLYLYDELEREAEERRA